MPASELRRIAELDRSERIAVLYTFRDGALEPRAVDLRATPWDPTGDGEHSVAANLRAWRPLLDAGGMLLGAFDGDALAGVAIYRPRLEPGMGNLAVLHVSAPARRKGVASRLVDEVERLARADGARHLYVSATPSGSAVGFYLRRGFVPTARPNAEMFALEPEDIHMVLDL